MSNEKTAPYRTIRNSRTFCLAGQDAALGWTLQLPGASAVRLETSRFASAARVMVAFFGPEARPEPLHPVVGAQFAEGEWSVRATKSGPATLEHPAFFESIDEIAPGEYLVRVRQFVAHPLWDSVPDHASSVVTIVVSIEALGLAAPSPIASSSHAFVVARLDELGVGICEPHASTSIVKEKRDLIEDAGGLLEAFGSTELGDLLLDAGAFFPIWGMRPWIYRFMTSEGSTESKAALGHEVHARRTYVLPPNSSELHLVRGSAFHGAETIDWDEWPTLVPRGSGDGLEIRSFASGGIEPLDPSRRVAIVPSFLLTRVPFVPKVPNSSDPSMLRFDPFAGYEEQADSSERALEIT